MSFLSMNFANIQLIILDGKLRNKLITQWKIRRKKWIIWSLIFKEILSIVLLRKNRNNAVIYLKRNWYLISIFVHESDFCQNHMLFYRYTNNIDHVIHCLRFIYIIICILSVIFYSLIKQFANFDFEKCIDIW